jgi:NADP-dependent 3-hydroxy acid dehydrogenase YdfG
VLSLNPRFKDWQGKRVWLIGASSGIGLALAQALHSRGAMVLVSARNTALLADFVDGHPGSRAFGLDVTDRLACAEVVREVFAEGPVDLLCCCAGYYRPMRANAFDLVEALHHQEVNVSGVLHVLDTALPILVWWRAWPVGGACRRGWLMGPQKLR